MITGGLNRPDGSPCSWRKKFPYLGEASTECVVSTPTYGNLLDNYDARANIGENQLAELAQLLTAATGYYKTTV